jgi:hypothetical protein
MRVGPLEAGIQVQVSNHRKLPRRAGGWTASTGVPVRPGGDCMPVGSPISAHHSRQLGAAIPVDYSSVSLSAKRSASCFDSA